MKSWQRPWVIILAGTTVLVVLGINGTFGLFLVPISKTFGWGRTPFALASAIGALLMGALSPFMGGVSDRFGTGRVILTGAVLWCLGLLVLSYATTPMHLIVGRGLLMGAAAGAIGMPVIVGVVTRNVPEPIRGRAAGIATAGTAIGQTLFLPLVQGLIASLGWQMALVAMAGLMVLLVPSAFGLSGGTPRDAGGAGLTLGTALGEAMGHRGFWMLTLGFFVCGVHYGFIVVHLPAAMIDRGMSATMGAAALFLVNLANIAGTILWGHWGDKRSKKYLLSTLYLTRTGVLALFFLLPLSPVLVVLLSLALGMAYFGTVPLTSGLVGQIFGVRYLSMLFGVVFFGHQVGTFLGSWLAGVVFDATGSYALMWQISLALGIASALIHLPINDRPLERVQPATAPAA